MLQSKVRIKKNALTSEQCAQLIANAKNFEYDILKHDVIAQSKFATKEELDQGTVESTQEDSYSARKVSQSPMEPVFSEWDGNPVYRCKIMKYEEGEYVNEHRDAQWMCLSNYWEPNTNMQSKSLMVIPLNDDYEGGEFTVEGQVVPQEVGTCIQIPCDPFSPETSPKHGVTEITKGTRYSLVFWNFA